MQSNNNDKRHNKCDHSAKKKKKKRQPSYYQAAFTPTLVLWNLNLPQLLLQHSGMSTGEAQQHIPARLCCDVNAAVCGYLAIIARNEW